MKHQISSKTTIIGHLQEIIRDHCGTRLAAIHRHYPNLKSEGRYRDAVVEAFNESEKALQNDWRAYAEADKVDMVITQQEGGRETWVRVEFKYHFTYDIEYRVSETIKAMSGKADLVNDLEQLRRGDFKGIAKDCLIAKGGNYQCDLFILIVQDRWGAQHEDAKAPASDKRWRCGYLHHRDVPLHFLNEQIQLMHKFGGQADNYHERWTSVMHTMLQLIHAARHFTLWPGIEYAIAPFGRDNIPLSSFFIGLDFTLPEPVFPGYSPNLYEISITKC